MATFSEIQTRVRTRLIDLPAATLAEVPTLVKEAHRELQSRHNFWVMQETLDANTTALTRNLVAVPSDFKEFRLAPYYTENTGHRVQMRVAKSQRELNGFFETDDTGYPKFIIRSEATNVAGASSFEVWPLSDGQSDWSAAPSGEYRVSIPYWKYLPALSASGDTDWFTANQMGEQFMIAHAVGHGFAVNWDVEKEAEWLSIAEAKFKKIVAEDKMLWFSGHDTFTPHTGADWDNQGSSWWWKHMR